MLHVDLEKVLELLKEFVWTGRKRLEIILLEGRGDRKKSGRGDQEFT